MRVQRLSLSDLRCFTSVSLRPSNGGNLLLGDNGAGKTTVLEALFLLSHGRSFRSGGTQALVRRGQADCTVFAEIESAGSNHRLGVNRSAQGWQAQVDGRPVPRLSALLAYCAAICIEPGSHGLIAGPAEPRRQFLDWGVFHVEHDFIGVWQHYRRSLRQRNVLLRRHADLREMEAWEHALSESADVLDGMRQRYLESLKPRLLEHLDAWVPELGQAQLRYQRGWSTEQALKDSLRIQRERDREQGYTRIGAHRAEWILVFAAAPDRHQLSRGQAKLVTLACLLAQFDLFREQRGEPALLLLDDLGAELDHAHLDRVMEYVLACGAQTWITGTDFPTRWRQQLKVFHVEQDGIRE